MSLWVAGVGKGFSVRRPLLLTVVDLSLCGCVLRPLAEVSRQSKCCLFTEARRVCVFGSLPSPRPKTGDARAALDRG
jgi:hypothetical protein